MTIVETRQNLRTEIIRQRIENRIVGFVPTMGALHNGHISLVERAAGESGIVVVSIFVNPTQFNNPDDLKNYPRTLESDIEKLSGRGVDFIFAPLVSEMYQVAETEEANYNFGELEKVMEGKHRPGHFKGVAQVVSKLFRIVEPDKAYFGEKDFQQLTIIRELVKKMNSAIQIIGCPTVRENSGLAMSSRNMLLSESERKEASKISQALFFLRDNFQKLSVNELENLAINQIEESGLMKVEYLEIVKEGNLEKVNNWHEDNRLRVCTAVKLGKVRLIDNVAVGASL